MKREKLVTVISGTVSSSDAPQLAELEAGRATAETEHHMAENITWLKESLEGEEDAGRRSDAETLLSVASKLTKKPSKDALRQIAKELQVHQKDRRMSELYDAVQPRVRDRVDELRKQSQERQSKRLRNEAVAVSGFAASSSDAGQFAVDDGNMSSATVGQDQAVLASALGVSSNSDAAQFAARSVLKRARPVQKTCEPSKAMLHSLLHQAQMTR